MKNYRCHKTVKAAKITNVMAGILSLENGYKRRVSKEWHQKHKPQVGGYLVEYDDRYLSFSPAKAFEEGYVCIDSDIQDQIEKKGLNGPRIKPSDVVDQINKIQWVQEGVLTICIITMQNGFIVTGESACADPDNFDETVGKEVAKRNAMNKIWPLLGYALREKLFREDIHYDPGELNAPRGQ